METNDVKNAVITGVRFDIERGLSAWLTLDYGGSCQGFGGFLLYAPEGWTAHKHAGNFAGHFIYRCLEIAGADDWAKLIGKTIRVRSDRAGLSGSIIAIGHIIKDDWFNPREEFDALAQAAREDAP